MRLCAFCCALLFCAGCASARDQWEEAFKDLRGDNMQMRYGSLGSPN
jgi:hypothetical protein